MSGDEPPDVGGDLSDVRNIWDQAVEDLHQCLRCGSLTYSPIPDRCGRCADWPEYDAADPTIGDLARVAEHVYLTRGWHGVVVAIMDAMKAFELQNPRRPPGSSEWLP